MRPSLVIAIVSFFLLLAVGGSVGAAAELRQVALVVGNGEYANVRKLKNPANDAHLIATKLKMAGFELIGGSERIDLNLHDFNRAIEDFAKTATDADIALLYFAGHGVQIKGENYLIPIDADPSTEGQVSGQSIIVGDTLKVLGKLNTKLNFLILDACRDNPFLSRTIYAASRDLASPDVGLAESFAPQGTIIWYATAPGRKAKDGIGANGPYTEAVAQFMDFKNLDVYGLFNRTGIKVFTVTERAQQPWLAASAIPGIYYFHSASGQSAFVPYDPDGELARGVGRGNIASQIFSEGISVPGRVFPFGVAFETVNARLDSSFEIRDWTALPVASEYGGEEVRYFWNYLPTLPVLQSALVGIDPSNLHCIDPKSYVAFFFKEQRFFHASIRLMKTSFCPSYDWLKLKLTPGDSRVLLGSDAEPVDLMVHDTGPYTVFEVTRGGVASAGGSVWKAD